MAKAIKAESLILRFTIMRELLLKLLRFVAGAVSKKKAESEPVLGNVLFYINSSNSQISCIATDQEIQLQKTIKLEGLNTLETTGNFTVPFRKLYEVIKNLPESSSINFVCTENKVSLISDRTKLNLNSLPPNGFETFSAFVGETNFTVKVEDLKRAVDQTAFAMADNDVRYYLNGMLFDIVGRELRTVAADGHRLAVNSVEILTGGNNHMQPYLRYLVPKKAVTEIQRILSETAGDNVVELAFRKNYICVSVNDGIFISKLLDSKFPEYQQLLEHNDTLSGGVLISDTQALKKACIRASVLFQDKSKGVQLRLNKKENLLKILAVNSYNDFVEDEIEVDYQGDNLEIGFNVKYLIDLLSAISAKVVKFIFSGSGASVFITGMGDGEGTYVLMPMKF